jgi:hypothetical protein
MFFEPLPEPPATAALETREVPPWFAPPELEIGAVVAVERIVARSANVAIAVPTIRAFGCGCTVNVEVVARQGAMPADDWWDLRMSGLPMDVPGWGRGERLPDRLLRMGVRYPDGAKATTLSQVGWRAPAGAEPPTGPLLSWQPGGSGGGRRSGGEYSFLQFGLWLWPLPPAAEFEFAVEWPFAGIGLTIVGLDGAAIASAARRSAPYWPDATDAGGIAR